MRRDRNQPKAAIARKSVAASVAMLGVLMGVVGLESGASGFSAPHGDSHGRLVAEFRRVVPMRGKTRTPPSTSTNTSTPTTVVPVPTVSTSEGGGGTSAKTTTTPPTTTATTTTPPPTTTTTTTPPKGTTNGALPNAPASLGAPSAMVLDDEFANGSLNTTLWSPSWFGNKTQQNGTTMSTSNVAVDGNGLQLTDAANNTGGIVSSNPADSQPGHPGFQIAPSPGKPVYVEYKATLPAAPNGQVANWPALWLVGQSPWPQNGEIDVMEGLGGTAAYHLHFGDTNGEGADGPGRSVNTSPGTHTYGVLWTTTGVTFVYDGAAVGTLNVALLSPMYIIMENSIGSYGGPTVLPAPVTVRYVRVWQ